MKKFLNVLLCSLFVVSFAGAKPCCCSKIGKFNPKTDLFLPQFDSKTDVDDVHSIAGIATILADERFEKVNYHAVAGAYGTQGGLYVPSNELFDLSFGDNWSDAHGDYEKALGEVSELVFETLENGGNIWIAEAGQSDFSADIVRAVKEKLPQVSTKEKIHIVQHSNWNEEVTSQDDLAFVREQTDYSKIPDGNAMNNGTPGFKTDDMPDWKSHITDARLIKIWEMAIANANKYNGSKDRYLNTAIKAGGIDFSDVSEACWIFGFADLIDPDAFFAEFAN